MAEHRKSSARDAGTALKAHRKSGLTHQRMPLRLGTLTELNIAASSQHNGVQPTSHGANLPATGTHPDGR